MPSDPPPPIAPKDYLSPKNKKRMKTVSSTRWVIRVAGMTFAISAMLALVSGTVIPALNIIFAFLILLMFIVLNVFFDTLGLAVATAAEKPFHSMAANRVPGASQALRLIKNADKVSSFCNDVVGDICGIISGATASVIVARVAADPAAPNIFISVLFSAVVSSLTVASKAAGKTLSIRHNTAIVSMLGRWVFRYHKLTRKLKKLFRK